MHDDELNVLRANVDAKFLGWALDQCAKEVQNEFVHLKSIRGSWVLGTLEFIERWPPEDQLAAMQAKVLSGGPDVQLTERQQQLLDRVGQGPSSGFGPRYMEMLDEFAAGRYPVDRAALRRALKRDLLPVLGRPEQLEGAEWRYRTAVGKWTVVTAIDSGGSTRQFQIGHVVQLADARLLSASPTRWWGIGGPTVWDRVSADDLDKATGAAADLCRYFIEQLPQMLHRL